MRTSTDPEETADAVSGREFLEAAAAGVKVRRLAEVAEWAIRHGHPRERADGRQDPMIAPGGDAAE